MRRFLWILALAPGLLFLGCSGAPSPPERIFLITIDTLRADHLGLYGYPRRTSPFLDQLGESSLVFETAFSSCSHTAPSHASLFTALHPAQHRLLQNGEELPESLLTLAQLASEQGYRTAAFTTVSFLQGLSAGFDAFHHKTRFHPARTILKEAEAWVRAQPPEDKLFLWIHLFDVHQWNREDQVDAAALAEIRRDSSLDGALQGAAFLEYLHRERGTVLRRGHEKILSAVDRYDGQILSTDRELRRFFEAMATVAKKSKDAGEALWIITSDHGEGLGSHDYMGHGKTIYTEQIRVPLLLHFTDRRYAPRRIDGLVRLVDVAPTLSEILGTTFQAQIIPPVGRSFLPLLRSADADWNVRAAFAQRRPADEKRLRSGWLEGDVYALQTERYKVIAHSGGQHEIYDLTKDPLELENLIQEPSSEGKRLLEGLLRQYRAMAAQGEQLGTGTINPEYVEELRALGYL